MPLIAPTPVTAAEFAALMVPLGPWDARPRVAVAVSGGADSMALSLLAAGWGEARGLIVDHGLRSDSAAEAALTAERLRARGIAAVILTLAVPRGPRLAERARVARYAALAAACAESGVTDLLLAHHAADQAETVLMRARHGSAAAGLAGMAAVRSTAPVRLLRPLLAVAPERLRATLRAAGMDWAEDPTNRDPGAERARLRALLLWADARGAASASLLRAAAAWSARRQAEQAGVAVELATHASLRPEGYAVLSAPVSPAALAALVQTIGGSPYPPPPAAVVRLAELQRAGGGATLAGVRMLPAGRLGPGHLLVREAASCAPPAPLRPGVLWDGRFRLAARTAAPEGGSVGALGEAAARLRRQTALPSAVLRSLPAWWQAERLRAVPHLCYPDAQACRGLALYFSPACPATAGFGEASTAAM